MSGRPAQFVHPNNGIILSEERLAQVLLQLPKIPGYPDYRIELCGNVYRVTWGLPSKIGCIPPHQLRSNINQAGYRRVQLRLPVTLDYIGRPTYPPSFLSEDIHRLVARTFLGPVPKDKHWVCHMDGETLTNHPSNLYYGSEQDNADDRVWHAQVGKGTSLSIRPKLRKLHAQRIEKFGHPNESTILPEAAHSGGDASQIPSSHFSDEKMYT